jgi:hypothetical protein
MLRLGFPCFYCILNKLYGDGIYCLAMLRAPRSHLILIRTPLRILFSICVLCSLCNPAFTCLIVTLFPFYFIFLQVVCSKYDMSLQSTSQVDRSALSCVINYYLNTDVFPFKVLLNFFTIFYVQVPL